MLSGMWHFYIVRTVDGLLYAGIATDVKRRFIEHSAGGRKCAKFFRAHKAGSLEFKRRIGSKSLALSVEYRFKQLTRKAKEEIILNGKLRPIIRAAKEKLLKRRS